jgi:DNA-binding NarL/FixJ family response regulator
MSGPQVRVFENGQVPGSRIPVHGTDRQRSEPGEAGAPPTARASRSQQSLSGLEGSDRAVSSTATRAVTGRPLVAVLTGDDTISDHALTTFFKHSPKMLWTGDTMLAEVAVAALRSPEAAVLSRLRQQIAERTALVVVLEGEWQVNLHQAVDLGVRAVLPRSEFTWEGLVQVVRRVKSGHGDMPTALQGRLMDQMQFTYRKVLAPRGLTAGGLTQREVNVLRRVAEGHELQDIGDELGYSERTIKNVLYGIIKRHRLRNRSHAVAFAIRSGMI